MDNSRKIRNYAYENNKPVITAIQQLIDSQRLFYWLDIRYCLGNNNLHKMMLLMKLKLR